MRFSSVPVMQAAVASVRPAAAPEGTMAASHSSNCAMRLPTASCRSAIRTKVFDIAWMAATDSGHISDPVIMVYTPMPLMTGWTPSSWRKFRAGAAARARLPVKAPAKGSAESVWKNPRRSGIEVLLFGFFIITASERHNGIGATAR